MPTTLTALATVLDPRQAVRVEVLTGTGYTLTFDTAEAGADRAGPSPSETVLSLLAACASMDVSSILRKKRQPPTSYRIAVTGEKRDEHPQVYTGIVIEHQVAGEVEPEAVRRAVELSATMYCPVNAMLSRSVRIEHRYLLRQGDRDEVSALVAITGPEGTQVL
jgi:putative redox protein